MRARRLALPIIEIAFGLYMSCCIWTSLWYGFGRGGVPFLVIFAGGYFYVGFSSLYVLWRMQQEAEEELAEAEPEVLSMRGRNSEGGTTPAAACAWTCAIS